MNFFSTPSWLDNFTFPFEKYSEVPDSVFNQINSDLDQVQSSDPLVTIVISAWDEEINILKCIASLSKTITTIPFDIIVVNNNSSDDTQASLDRLHVKTLFQSIQGCGPSRQLAQENARGKYILLADADCIYPKYWIDDMLEVLQKPGVVCVYGRYSFISEKGFPRWQLAILENMKDVITEVRHIKHPYYNAYGISMGYVKELGLKVGFVMTKFWGDDGKLCMDLMQYGKIKQVRSNRARAWTGPRTLQRDGSFVQALKKRLMKEVKRFDKVFKSTKQ